MPPFLLAFATSKIGRYIIIVSAAFIALAIAVARVFSAGKKAQRAADASVTTNILEKQRDAAANPLAPGAARQRLRDGEL